MSGLKQRISDAIAQPLQTNPPNANSSKWSQLPYPKDWARFITACRDPMLFPGPMPHWERMSLSSDCFNDACNSFASRDIKTVVDNPASVEEQNTTRHSITEDDYFRTFTTGVPNIPIFANMDGCRGEQNCTAYCHDYARRNVYNSVAVRDFYLELGVAIGSLIALGLTLYVMSQCCNKGRSRWSGHPKTVEELSRLPEEKGAIAPMPKRRVKNAPGTELDPSLPNRQVVITQPVPNTTSTDIANEVVPVATPTTTTEVVPVTDRVPTSEVIPASNLETANHVARVPNPVANRSVQPTTNAQTTTEVVPVPASSVT